MESQSIPTSTVLPDLVYRDVAEAPDWLSAVIGFVEHYRCGASKAPQGTQMSLGDAWIMVERARGEPLPGSAPRVQYLTIFAPNVAPEASGAILADR